MHMFSVDVFQEWMLEHAFHVEGANAKRKRMRNQRQQGGPRIQSILVNNAVTQVAVMFVQELMEECHISVVAAREAAADTGQTVQILVITRKKSCLE